MVLASTFPRARFGACASFNSGWWRELRLAWLGPWGMTGFFVTVGLLLQAAALILLLRRLRSAWFTHIGAVFIVLAIAYHGLGEILLLMFSHRDPYRLLVSANYVG